MALIFPDTLCPLCSKNVHTDGDYFATSAFLISGHPLWRFSDVAIHWRCFLSWEQKAVFTQAYKEVVVSNLEANTYWDLVLEKDDLYITYGSKIHEFNVLFVQLATSIRVKKEEMAYWLCHPDSENP